MDVSVAKTINDFRDEIRLYRELYERNGLTASNAQAEIAHTVLQSLAETGDTALFVEAEEDVKSRILRDLRHYRRTGRRASSGCNSFAGCCWVCYAINGQHRSANAKVQRHGIDSRHWAIQRAHCM